MRNWLEILIYTAAADTQNCFLLVLIFLISYVCYIFFIINRLNVIGNTTGKPYFLISWPNSPKKKIKVRKRLFPHYKILTSNYIQNIQTWKRIRTSKNNKKKRTVAQEKKEFCFEGDLDYLFDIAHADAKKLIKIKEDIDFLKAQSKEGRRGCMVGADNKFILST